LSSTTRATPWVPGLHHRCKPQRGVAGQPGRAVVTPFQGYNGLRTSRPRAAPWAIESRPSGAEAIASQTRVSHRKTCVLLCQHRVVLRNYPIHATVPFRSFLFPPTFAQSPL
jgi:hypothetical protein